MSEGFYAVKLSSVLIENGNVVPGILTNGKIGTAASGFPVTGCKPVSFKPDVLKGYYKFYSTSGDSAVIKAYLFKWNSGLSKRDTIGTAFFKISTVDTIYQSFEQNITYTSGNIPDSALILIANSYGNNYSSNILFVDDVSLSENEGSKAMDPLFTVMQAIKASAYPNPASEKLTVAFDEPNEWHNKTITLHDLKGILVFKTELQQPDVCFEIDCSAFEAGNYLLKIDEPTGKSFSQIIHVNR